MAATLATRLRALWLVWLLALAPAGPLGLILSGHATGEETHAVAVQHDPSDHGISAGALAEHGPDRHCLFCQTASSLRFGGIQASARLHAPHSAAIDWIEWRRPSLRSDARATLPARAPPFHA